MPSLPFKRSLIFSFNRIIEIRNGKDSLSHLVLAPCQTDIVPLGLWTPTASRHACNGAVVPCLGQETHILTVFLLEKKVFPDTQLVLW